MTVTLPVTGKFYEAEKSKTGIILFHAYTGSPNDFNLLARKLQNLGLEVYCPLFEGHGTQDIFDILDAHPDDWWIQAQEVLSFMQARDYDHIGIFGLSLGGIFATRLLSENHDPQLFGGVFNSPVITFGPIDVSYFFNLYAKDLYRRQDQIDHYQQVHSQMMDGYKNQIQEIYYFTTAFHMNLQDITNPFFIAQSGKDEMIDPQSAYLLQEALIHAPVSFHWFEDNSHVITINRDRAAFEEALIDFISAQA